MRAAEAEFNKKEQGLAKLEDKEKEVAIKQEQKSKKQENGKGHHEGLEQLRKDPTVKVLMAEERKIQFLQDTVMGLCASLESSAASVGE